MIEMGMKLIQGANEEEARRKFKDKYPDEKIRSCSLMDGKKTVHIVLFGQKLV